LVCAVPAASTPGRDSARRVSPLANVACETIETHDIGPVDHDPAVRARTLDNSGMVGSGDCPTMR